MYAIRSYYELWLIGQQFAEDALETCRRHELNRAFVGRQTAVVAGAGGDFDHCRRSAYRQMGQIIAPRHEAGLLADGFRLATELLRNNFV